MVKMVWVSKLFSLVLLVTNIEVQPACSQDQIIIRSNFKMIDSLIWGK